MRKLLVEAVDNSSIRSRPSYLHSVAFMFQRQQRMNLNVTDGESGKT